MKLLGTATGRTQCKEPNYSSPPRSAGNYMNELITLNGIEYVIFRAPISKELIKAHRDSQPEFTFGEPERPNSVWSQKDFVQLSLSGHKLFLKNNEVGKLSDIKAMRIKHE